MESNPRGVDPLDRITPLGDRDLREEPTMGITYRTDDIQDVPSLDGDVPDEVELTRAEIEQTRAEMSETIAAIQEKLNPDILIQQAKDTMHDATIGKVEDAVNTAGERVQELVSTAGDRVQDAVTTIAGPSAADAVSNATVTAKGMGATVIDVVKKNPVPSAAAGLALGWLFMRNRRNHERQQYWQRSYPVTTRTSWGTGYSANPADTAYWAGYSAGRQTDQGASSSSSGGPGEALSNVAGAVGDMAGQAGQTVGQVTSQAGETVGQVTSQAGEVLGSAGSNLVESIRQNPLPAALAGLGLGWFYMSTRNTPRQQISRNMSGYGSNTSYTSGMSGQGQNGSGVGQIVNQATSTVGDVASQAQDTVGQVASQAGQTVGQVAGAAQETVGQVAGQAGQAVGSLAGAAQQQAELLGVRAHLATMDARDTTQRLLTNFQRTLEENPLGVGAVVLGLGIAAGLAVPETPQENQLMGEARDALAERAQQTAQQTMQKVQGVAGEAINAAKDAARDEAQNQNLVPSS